MFTLNCTRWGKPSQTLSSQLESAFTFPWFYSFCLMAIYEANLDPSVNCLKLVFRLYPIWNGMEIFIVRSKHLFMMIKLLFFFFSLYVLVNSITQNIPVQFFKVITQHHFTPCVCLRLCYIEEELFVIHAWKKDQAFSCSLEKKYLNYSIFPLRV